MKSLVKIPEWANTSIADRPALAINHARARCSALNIRLSLWLLFDIAAGKDSFVRDGWLRDYKRHASRFGKARSIHEGAKWLAVYGDGDED